MLDKIQFVNSFSMGFNSVLVQRPHRAVSAQADSHLIVQFLCYEKGCSVKAVGIIRHPIAWFYHLFTFRNSSCQTAYWLLEV